MVTAVMRSSMAVGENIERFQESLRFVEILNELID